AIVQDACNVTHGPIRVSGRSGIAVRVHITKDNATFSLQPVERGLVCSKAAFAVRNRNLQNLTGFVPVRIHGICILYSKSDRLGYERESNVAHERPRKEPRLTRDLESVADGQHRATAPGVLHDFVHHRAESCNRSGTEIVTVGKTARKNHDVRPLEVMILVPEVGCSLAKYIRDSVVSVVVAVGTWKGDNAELHAASTAAISKSSVTGFARSFSHISRAEASAAAGELAVTSTMICRPT